MALKVGECRDANWLRTYIRLSVEIMTGASAEGDFLVIVKSGSGRLNVFRLSEDGKKACLLAYADDVTNKDGPLKDMLEGKRSH